MQYAEIEHARHCAIVAREWAAELLVRGSQVEADALLAASRNHAAHARQLACAVTRAA